MNLSIECEGYTFQVWIDNDDPRNTMQKLIKLQLNEGPEIFDTLYVQLELTREEGTISKEVLNRLAGRGVPPFTRMRIRRE